MRNFEMNDPKPTRSINYWAYGALALWAAGAASLLNRTPYGLDESAARVMLFLWSFVEDLANPIVTLGVPDFRAVLLIPAGFAFPGNVFAIKLLTLAVAASAAVGMFRWFGRDGDPEAPMIATGLWLLSPQLIGQIDRISVEPFLLWVLIAGAFLERSYRARPMPFGGRYFALILLSPAAVTLHPSGIAYPLVIALSWITRPPPEGAGDGQATSSGPKPFFATGARIGLPVSVTAAAIFGLWLAGGWPGVSWFGNPVTAATGAVLGWAQPAGANATTWIIGGTISLLVAASVWKRRSALWNDGFGCMVVAAAAISLLTGDSTWVMFSTLIILYWGFPLLLGLRLPRMPVLLRERGLALVILVVLATLFMSQDRARFSLIRSGLELSAQDQLIRGLAELVKRSAPEPGARGDSLPAKGLSVASQWPGRTMVACSCNTLPLPPVGGDENDLLKMLKGIDFIVFDPRNPANQSLSRNLALLGGQDAETVALQAGGVIVRVRTGTAPPAAPEASPGK